VIGLLVWPVGVSKNTKKDKVTENSHPTQTPFPSSHINQILHAGSYRGYLSWFWVSLKLVKNVGAVEGRNFGIPIDLAHCLYNSLLLSHKPWWIFIRQSRQQTINRWQLTAISRPKSYFFSRVRDMEHSTPPDFFLGGGPRTATDFDVWSSFERNFRPTRNPLIQ